MKMLDPRPIFMRPAATRWFSADLLKMEICSCFDSLLFLFFWQLQSKKVGDKIFSRMMQFFSFIRLTAAVYKEAQRCDCKVSLGADVGGQSQSLRVENSNFFFRKCVQLGLAPMKKPD
jgi:hypothetical protein